MTKGKRTAAGLGGWAAQAQKRASDGHDVYLFFIGSAKERSPAAAQAVIERLA